MVVTNKYIGKRFGKLLVTELAEDKYYKDKRGKSRRLKKYKVKCDCGREKIVLGQDLKSGKTKSCHEQECYIQYPDLSMPAFNKIYNQYCKEAKKKDRDFTIDRNHFRELITKNCYYCGDPPSNISNILSGPRKSGS